MRRRFSTRTGIRKGIRCGVLAWCLGRNGRWRVRRSSFEARDNNLLVQVRGVLRRVPAFLFERSEGTLVHGSQEFQSTAFLIRSTARSTELNGLIGEVQGGVAIEGRRDLA